MNVTMTAAPQHIGLLQALMVQASSRRYDRADTSPWLRADHVLNFRPVV